MELENLKNREKKIDSTQKAQVVIKSPKHACALEIESNINATGFLYFFLIAKEKEIIPCNRTSFNVNQFYALIYLHGDIRYRHESYLNGTTELIGSLNTNVVKKIPSKFLCIKKIGVLRFVWISEEKVKQYIFHILVKILSKQTTFMLKNERETSVKGTKQM